MQSIFENTEKHYSEDDYLSGSDLKAMSIGTNLTIDSCKFARKIGNDTWEYDDRIDTFTVNSYKLSDIIEYSEIDVYESSKLNKILNGASPRILIEGYFSNLNLELNEKLDDVRSVLQSNGDFEFGNQLNPSYREIQDLLSEVLKTLDKFGVDATKAVDTYVKNKPNAKMSEVISYIQEEFL